MKTLIKWIQEHLNMSQTEYLNVILCDGKPLGEWTCCS